MDMQGYKIVFRYSNILIKHSIRFIQNYMKNLLCILIKNDSLTLNNDNILSVLV